MYEFHLFAGIGGGVLGGMLNGNIPVGAVEIEEYARKVLVQRQLDGCLPIFPIWDDVRTFRAKNKQCGWFIDYLRSIRKELRICGGFPCQDISILRHDKKGIDGERSGLWSEFRRILDEIRPKECFMENAPIITVRGLERILADLAELGYDAKWGVISGPEAGIRNIRRKRWWLLGYNTQLYSLDETKKGISIGQQVRGLDTLPAIQDVASAWLISNSYACREIDGNPDWVERFKSIGNAQIPQVAALAEEILR